MRIGSIDRMDLDKEISDEIGNPCDLNESGEC